MLYLLTGTSFARIQKHLDGTIQGIPGVPIKYLQQITIPNSLWTAGCCVREDGNSVSFAVMGNNVPKDDQESLTLQITVKELQNILAADVFNRGIGQKNVVLFPGDPDCALYNMGDLPLPGVGR